MTRGKNHLLQLEPPSLATAAAAAAGTAPRTVCQYLRYFQCALQLAAAVGGDKAAVSVIIPDGTEPHDFEPGAGPGRLRMRTSLS